MKTKTVGEFIRFVCIGLVGSGVILACTYLGVHAVHLWYLWAYCAAALIGWTVIFIGNVLFTFPQGERKAYGRKYVSFMLGYAAFFWVNAGLVYLFTSVLAVNYLISIVLATAITTTLTFSFSKFIVFRGHENG